MSGNTANGNRVNAPVFIPTEGYGPGKRSQGTGKYRGHEKNTRSPASRRVSGITSF